MIIEIAGIGRVEVDDSFAGLSQADQSRIVDQIKREAGQGVKSSGGEAAEVESQKLRAIAQGISLGFADELEAAAMAPLSKLGEVFGLSEGKSYEENLAEIRGKLEAYRKDAPLEAIGMEIGGALLPTIAASIFTAGAGGAAAGSATAARLAPTLARAAAIGAAEGGIAGFGSGEGGFTERAKSAATGAALGGTVGAAAPVAAQKIGQAGRRVLDAFGVGGQKRALTFAERKMLEAIERENLTPDKAMDMLNEARRLGVTDMTIADLGENLRGTAWRAQATPNPMRQQVFEQFQERGAGQAEQIAEQAAEVAGVRGATGVNFIEELAARTEREVAPLYDEAFTGAKAVLDPKPFQQFMGRGAMRDAYSAARKIADADPDFGGQLPSFDRLVTGNGIPTEVAHNMKKGLDALIEGQTDAVTGKMTSQGRAYSKLRSRFNDEIVKQNPAYAKANAAFADKAKLSEAYKVGSDFNKLPEKELAKRVSKMTASEREALRVGLVSQVEELASKTGDASNFVKTIFGSPRRRAALKIALGDKKKFETFERMMKLQSEKQRTARKVFGGSETAEREMAKADAGIDPSSIINLGAQAATGNVVGAGTSLAGQLAGRVAGISEKSAAELSRMLFTANPAQQRQILDALVQRGVIDTAKRQQILRRPEFYSGTLGAAGGLLAGQE